MFAMKHEGTAWKVRAAAIFAGLFLAGAALAEPPPDNRLPFEIAGLTVTPHVFAPDLRYPEAPDTDPGVRVEIFVRNRAPRGGTNRFSCNALRFANEAPLKYLQDNLWAWHDTPSLWSEEETLMLPGGLAVWRFNTKGAPWGPGRTFPITVVDWQRIAQSEWEVALNPQGIWFSSIVFTSHDGNVSPDAVTLHIANESATAARFIGARLFLPETNDTYRALFPQPPLTGVARHPADGWIAPGDKGCFQARVGRLPLTYAAVQAILEDQRGQQFAIWSHLRIKREVFDIGGGWIQESDAPGNTLLLEPFLKTLQRMHVNTANLVSIPGYTDQNGPSGLYMRYPLKRFGPLEPASLFSQDALLPFVHGVEMLGEPQFEEAAPRPPQAVWQSLLPFAKSRLTTTVTLSDASTWRYYAGLSDFPHFDAYRVAAPSVDDWMAYDRWGEKRITWGAPLETIGSMCRSLREMSRPKPIACWSQGPHFGWNEIGERKRTSPTPDEIRLQAYHALSSRITSLYWFNLSLRSLVQFRDTIEEITRIGREINMLADFYIEGDAYRYRRLLRDGKPDWDLASIVSPKGAVLFALDLDYEPDRGDKVFLFKRRREGRFNFDLPVYLRAPADVFRVDAEGVYDVKFEAQATGITIEDRQHKVAIYVAAPSRETRAAIERKRLELVTAEQALNFDPARRGRDFDVLKNGLGER